MVSDSNAPGSSGLKRRRYKVSRDEDNEAVSAMVNEELDMDSDDEIDLEIDGEGASERSSYEQPDSESERDTSGACFNRWRAVNTEDRKLKKYNFTKNAGPKLGLPSDAEPIDYFTLFFNEELLSEIVTETNRYVKEKNIKTAGKS
jgi:hypothetical protein